MDYIKFLAVASVVTMSMAPAVHAQSAEDCDAAAATESLEDDCIPVIPDPIAPLTATNFVPLIPVAVTFLVAGIAAAGNNGGSTPDTQ